MHTTIITNSSFQVLSCWSATSEDILMPENTVEYFQIRSGQQVAFIKSGDGTGEINFCAID